MRIHLDMESPTYLSWDNGRSVGGSIRNGYKRVRYGGKWLNHHILIWELTNGEIPEGMEIDHIDRNTLNNHPSNLRLVSRSLNCRNRGKHRNNVSGIKGLYFHKAASKWYGQTRINGKTYLTKYYDSKETALSALTQLREELGYDKSL